MVYQLAAKQDSDVLNKFSVSTVRDRGVLRLVQPLDFEEKRLYQVVVEARDRATQDDVNRAQATILVSVGDLPDQPPQWVTVTPVTRILEGTAPYTPVSIHTLTTCLCHPSLTWDDTGHYMRHYTGSYTSRSVTQTLGHESRGKGRERDTGSVME